MAQWLEDVTDDRMVAASNPTDNDWEIGQFRLPHFVSVFRKKQKATGPFYL